MLIKVKGVRQFFCLLPSVNQNPAQTASIFRRPQASQASPVMTNANPQERIGAYPILHSLPTLLYPASSACQGEPAPDAPYIRNPRRCKARSRGDSETGATAKSDSDSRTRAGTVRSPAARLLVGDGRADGDPPDRRADLDEPFRVLRGMFTSHPWSLIPGFIPLSVAALIPQALPRSSGSAGSGCVAYLEWSSPITWPSIDSGVSSIDCR